LFQDLSKKIQVLKRNVLGCKEELKKKLTQVVQVEKQLDVSEIGITRRRSRMMTLQERSDGKLERLRTAKLQLAMLDESSKRNSFNEDLEMFEAPYEPPKVEERSQLGFADILKLSKNAPKKPKSSLTNNQHTKKGNNINPMEQYRKQLEEFNNIKEKFEFKEIKANIERSKKRMSMVSDIFLKERKRVNCIQEKVINM